MVTKPETNHLKCMSCGYESPLYDHCTHPPCPKCPARIGAEQKYMVEVNPKGDMVDKDDILEKAPVLSGKDMNTLMYLLLGKVGTIEIPQEVFDGAPGPEKLTMERQWDGTNKIWRFFIKKKPKNRKPKLVLPKKRVILS